MNDEDFRKLLEEEAEDSYEDAKKVLDEEWEFNRKNFFNYLTAAALGYTLVASAIAMFLVIMHHIYN